MSKIFVHGTLNYNEPHQYILKYKQIQITSTKCQYQAAASKPKWWEGENWCTEVRIRHTSRNVEPINTWVPWNPVVTKIIEPYTLSAIVNDVSIYSLSWRIVKYKPIAVVKKIAFTVLEKSDSRRLWWAQVTVIPEANRIVVFSSGTLRGFTEFMPVGGQLQPSSWGGDRLIWKNVQKKAKKNIISEVINNIMPKRKFIIVFDVWYPIKVLSRIRSRYHWYMDNSNIISASNIGVDMCRWKKDVKLNIIVKVLIEVVSGHGLTSRGANDW